MTGPNPTFWQSRFESGQGWDVAELASRSFDVRMRKCPTPMAATSWPWSSPASDPDPT